MPGCAAPENIMQNNHALASGDQKTKQAVIGTICGIAWMCGTTTCVLALRQLPIPVEVKDITLYVLGVISGSLMKTGMEAIQGQRRADAGPSGTQADPIAVEPVDGAAVVVEEK